ncbi:hypothetical protein KI387_030957 [Taxus chinensis]|uniref:SHSP domain-containing protein n=1 Tax=Taxus chinensis TaxID=29808 RepID=A0AA38FEQ7_TAXCH|nr:hypothetical protein KI387_030957 [Taxus chinensis]
MMMADHHMDLMQQYSVSQGHVISQPANLPKPMAGPSSNDQRFLLIFIMGTYFGPDLKNEIPKQSVLQRIGKSLPPYTFDQLETSFMKLSEVENIYYYILRKAHPSCAVKLHSLYKFFQGRLPPPLKEVIEDDRQFTSFFPQHLHRQIRHKGRYKVFEGIVSINDPDVSYIKPEDLERFKQLTGLNDLKIDKEEARNYRHPYGPRTERGEGMQLRVHANASPYAYVQDGRPLAVVMPDGVQDHQTKTTKRRKEPMVNPDMPTSAMLPKEEKPPMKYPDNMGKTVLMIASAPSIEQWNSSGNDCKPSILFTGTATARQAGPSVGLVDIGTCEDAYLFRMALPGVKKDQREFSCEVESDGKVVIRGIITTGEQKVIKKARTFHMKTQSLCPPGPFTVAFQLPGPVEPRQFTGTFGSDGILEGIVMKPMDKMRSACLVFDP